MKKSVSTTTKYLSPRISVTVSIEELLAIMMMMTMGKMFTKPKYREQVKTTFNRIGKTLVRRGLKPEVVDKMLAHL